MKNKTFIIFLVIFIFTFCLCGCSNKEDTVVSSVENSSNSQNTISSSENNSKSSSAFVSQSKTYSSNSNSIFQSSATNNSSSQKSKSSVNSSAFNSSSIISADASSSLPTDKEYTATKSLNSNWTNFDFLNITKNENIKTSFNNYSFYYSSTQPIKGELSYKINGNNYIEEFFLESGTNLQFSSLIDNYINNEKASELLTIKFKSLSAQTNLTIKNFSTNVTQVLNSETYYFQNSKYKLGINLSWGGGISYLEDLKDNDVSITNLINNADTGRLVQQSYYGISDSPYICGTYNSQKWRYNPVQGGNLAGECSKTIDYSIDAENNTIFVKSRPRDWAKNGVFADAYMENTYTLNDNYVKVDNRFIDFSGYTHSSAEQELPAFYTLSYFNKFAYYDGAKPWSNDTPIIKDNLPFWGEYRSQCLFNLSTSESWCAWLDNHNNGIGLFVPNVTSMLAGRHNFNASKDANNSATNYVAPLRVMTLKSFEPIEYSYFISTGSIDAMRSTFVTLKASVDNKSLGFARTEKTDFSNFSFKSANNIAIFESLNNCLVQYSDNAAMFSYLGTDSYAGINYSTAFNKISTSTYKKLKITYKCSQNVSGEVFYCTGSTLSPNGNMSKRFTYANTNDYKTITLDFSNDANWTGNSNYLRFDFDITAQTPIYLQSIALA